LWFVGIHAEILPSVTGNGQARSRFRRQVADAFRIMGGMNRELLMMVSCPRCRGGLEAVGETPEAIACASCGASYPVAGGVPRLGRMQRDAVSREVEIEFGGPHEGEVPDVPIFAVGPLS